MASSVDRNIAVPTITMVGFVLCSDDVVLCIVIVQYAYLRIKQKARFIDMADG